MTPPTERRHQTSSFTGIALGLYLTGAWFKTVSKQTILKGLLQFTLPQGKCHDSTSIGLWPLPSKFQSISHPIILWHVV
jgi:hypothetical protein